MLSRSFYQNFGSRSRYCYQIKGFGSCKVHITVARGSASSAVTAPCDMVAGDVLSDLKPALLWHFFKDLTQIPRPSKHEQRWVLFGTVLRALTAPLKQLPIGYNPNPFGNPQSQTLLPLIRADISYRRFILHTPQPVPSPTSLHDNPLLLPHLSVRDELGPKTEL